MDCSSRGRVDGRRRGRGSRAGQARNPREAAPVGHDLDWKVLWTPRWHGARQGSVRCQDRSAKRRLPARPGADALGWLRPKHQGDQGREDARPAGHLGAAGQGQGSDRSTRVGGRQAAAGCEGRRRRCHQGADRRGRQGLRELPRQFPRETTVAVLRRFLGPAAAGLLLLGLAWAAHAQQGDAQRGQYISKAAGCVGCHTEARDNAQPFAGGRALKTPFGTFYGPNITPHPQAGIGRWTEQDLIRAIREGRRPDGAHYFPAFPYPSFTRINDQDLRDLWAYLRTLPPSARPSEPHDLKFPFGWRWLVWVWKLFFFNPGPFSPDPAASAARPEIPLWLALAGVGLEAVLLQSGAVLARSRGEHRGEPRQLPRERARALRRVPYPAQLPRRDEAQPPSRRRQAG